MIMSGQVVQSWGFIHSQWTNIPVLGNHEYWPLIAETGTALTSITVLNLHFQ